MSRARAIVRALGGDWHGHYGLVPGLGHSRKDRSVKVKDAPKQADGIDVHSFAGDSWQDFKQHLVHRGLLEPFEPSKPLRYVGVLPPSIQHPRAPDNTAYEAGQRRKARSLWSQSIPATGTVGERYLRGVRAYGGPIPGSIRFLPATDRYPDPKLIAAFALASEPEPGAVEIGPDNIAALHQIRLKPDGSDKSEVKPVKWTTASPSGKPIVLAPMNDLLGLIICEGIETGLSLAEATGCGVWASGGAPHMANLAHAVPDYTDCVTIDIEAGKANRDARIELRRRLEQRGIYVEPDPDDEGAA